MTYAIILICVGIVLTIYLTYFRRKKSANPLIRERDELEAKRYARLVVMQIQLYESEKIEQGLAKNDLYSELWEEIETARKTYVRRCSKLSLMRFFDEAVVDLLANGDEKKLGNRYKLSSADNKITQ